MSEGFRKDLEKAVNETLIDIKDFRRYHTYDVKGNDKMYVHAIKKRCNERYDEFFEKILKPRANSENKIRCDVAAMLWAVFEDSNEVLGFIKVSKFIPTPEWDIVDHWLKEFQRPVEELRGVGLSAVSSAYGILVEYYKRWTVQQKYERIYSSSDKFADWVVLFEKNQTLVKGEERPFDLREIAEKIKALASVTSTQK
jgi:hypothetical protein